jgi:hypothetical protein
MGCLWLIGPKKFSCCSVSYDQVGEKKVGEVCAAPPPRLPSPAADHPRPGDWRSPHRGMNLHVKPPGSPPDPDQMGGKMKTKLVCPLPVLNMHEHEAPIFRFSRRYALRCY